MRVVVRSRPEVRTGDLARTVESVGMEREPGPVGEASSLDDVIARYKEGVDRTLLREALTLSPSQRVAEMIELSRFAEALAGAPRVER